jgi:type IV pilus assembly protein PilY1
VSNAVLPTAIVPTSANPTITSLVSGTPYYLSATQKTCATGDLYNYSTPSSPVDVGPASLTNTVNTAGLLDYGALPGAYSVLGNVQIANEGAKTRSGATPIFYDVKITQDGLLSFSYSFTGLSYNAVITKQLITTANGPLPPYFRFGFAGSTGGSTNVHEIACFKAAPASQSGSSTTVNERQSAKITPNATQAYFAYYNPNDSTGRLTANFLGTDKTTGAVVVDSTPNWDAACTLNGVANGENCLTTNAPGPISPQSPDSRTILTWDGTQGVPFKWGNLSAGQKSALDNLDATATADRLNYLRGDRSNEVNSVGVGLFRARSEVLGDIVDSSPAWVGVPNSPYTATWHDRLHPASATPENAATYVQFINDAQTRQNVVYSGSNDGLLHGFRAGTFDSSGAFSASTNDGKEVLAYMPGAVVQTIHTVSADAQGNVDGTLDFANTQYMHQFFVDAPPGTGDLFYAGAWHTWLVGGLGPGGAAIYALDITDPSQFSEGNAASLVVGEWTPSSIPGGCIGNSTCGNSLGNTYGIPLIRRLHDGKWGVIFGNGLGSSSGDAGIFIMTVEPSDGTKRFYYLSTGASGGNGIAYVDASDMDGDHVTDYVYAGDLHGNLWRFDLTSDVEGNWGATVTAPNTSPTPLFTTPGGQPITTKVSTVSGVDGGGRQRMIVAFGTGQKIPYTITTQTSYAKGKQSFYGIWDWNMSSWNAQSSVQYESLDFSATGLSSTPANVIQQGNIQKQVISISTATSGPSVSAREIQTTSLICWQGSTQCATNNHFGWYFDLPGAGEQVIYNPEVALPGFTFNTIVPADNKPTECTLNTDKGFTYQVSALTGGAIANSFPQYNDATAVGVETDATGTSFLVQNSAGETYLIYQTVTNSHGSTQLKLPANTKANRLTWIQVR